MPKWDWETYISSISFLDFKATQKLPYNENEYFRTDHITDKGLKYLAVVGINIISSTGLPKWSKSEYQQIVLSTQKKNINLVVYANGTPNYKIHVKIFDLKKVWFFFLFKIWAINENELSFWLEGFFIMWEVEERVHFETL